MKGLRLSNRDLKLFEYLHQYGILSTQQVRSMVFENIDKRTVLRRLRKLWKKRYLHRVTGPNGVYVWYLPKLGAKAIGCEPVMKGVNRNTIEHDLLVTDSRDWIEGFLATQHWTSSHSLRQKSNNETALEDRATDTIPDWLFIGKLKNKGPKMIALEVEIHFKGRKRMDRIFEIYAYKDSIDYLWYLVPNKKIGQSLLQEFKKCNVRDNQKWLWFSVIEDLKTDIKNAKIYTTKGEYSLGANFALLQQKSQNLGATSEAQMPTPPLTA